MGTGKDASSSVEHSLKLVSRDLWGGGIIRVRTCSDLTYITAGLRGNADYGYKAEAKAGTNM